MSRSSTPSRIRWSEDGTKRQGKLLTLQGYSSRDTDGVAVDEAFLYMHVASFLAFQHVQERSGVVVASLPERLGGCDFDWTFEARDTQNSPRQAVRALVAATTDPTQVRQSSTSATYLSNITTANSSTSMENGYWILSRPQQEEPEEKTQQPTQSPTEQPTQNPTQSPTASPTNSPTTATTTSSPTGTEAPTSLAPTADVLTEPPRTVPPRTPPPPRTSVPIPRDTQPPFLSPRGGSRKRHLQDITATSENNNNEEWQFPFGIVGAVFSSVTSPLTLIGQAFELPQISGSATSAQLDSSPFFARSIPTNAGDARAAMLYYHNIGVTHVACLYIRDPWGNYYNADLQRAANQLNIHMESFSYDENKASIESALQQLKQSGLKYVYSILFDWRPVLLAAQEMKVIGHDDYVWIGAEMFEWTSEALELSRHDPVDQKLALALRGVGSLVLDGGTNNNEGLQTAMAEFVNSTTLQQEYMSAHVSPEDRHIFDNFTFVVPTIDPYQKLFYDATYSLAIAACETPGLFTGPELFDTLVHLEFQGVTGTVTFDTTTGTRNPDSVTYRIDNVFWSDERSDDDYIRFDTNLAVVVTKGQVEHAHRWIHFDNTTHRPLPIPPFEHDYNLIPVGAQVVGWVLGIFVAGLSVGIMAWTYCHRKRFVVRASQPIFLVQVCVGTLIMSLAVVPMSMQGEESTPRLDVACMGTPWLLFLGFVVAFSALFSKTWRLNKLLASGQGFKRIEVQAKDVMWPFAVLMTINVTLLLGWTFVSPAHYVRVDGNDIDEYGRSLESWGQCKSHDNKFLYFLIPILFFNMVGIATATYQSYVARDLPTTLSESSYLAVSMLSLMESFFLGGPMLFLVMGRPTAYYLVGSAMLFIVNACILLPVFVPKYLQRNATQRGRGGTASLASSVPRTGNGVRLSATAGRDEFTERGKMHIARASTGTNSYLDYSSGTNGTGEGTRRREAEPVNGFDGHASFGQWQGGAVRFQVQGLPPVAEDM
ncbi:Gamma-aminobutyric acid (GABA) B receptor [Seminavis robusta]|uniref:Gamma-aminobutyric acid (GABA) B receptor n=1 Tax=Seminavis robusta TaxID=568900 RepID=A0A9N8E709_9STRA|nr:Gamma-aminobutyric acid (GABA) B receptor [Seminavis robusta]|eukprot:Sro618_g176200.1 Gamma-aminobutyric acid (GABA) B receptor (993) ;mRNA; f:14903-17881